MYVGTGTDTKTQTPAPAVLNKGQLATRYISGCGLDPYQFAIRNSPTAFLKGKTSPTRFLDKTIWNPRPVINLLRTASRAIFESGVSFLHFWALPLL